jgi:chromate transporter
MKFVKTFAIFFKIGMLTIGGGLAMIPIMKEEFVDKNKWVKDEDITDIFAVAQGLPGVVAINSSIYIGYRLSGMAGAIISAIGVILPSLIVIFTIYVFFTPEIANNVYLIKAFRGINAGITALILGATIQMAKKSIIDIFGIFIAIISFVLVFFFKVDIIFVMVLSIILGVSYYKIKKMVHKK